MSHDVPILTEADCVRLVHGYIEGLFPKTCPKCKRIFATYRDYLLNTKRVGLPISYDIEFGDWTPTQPTGNLSLANCSCGTTLALSSENMPVAQIWQVLNWVRVETERRGCHVREVLSFLRDEVVKRALAQQAADLKSGVKTGHPTARPNGKSIGGKGRPFKRGEA
jgi:hypothetical protein